MTLKELAKELDLIKSNHLVHMQADIDKIGKKVDGLDNRLWWVLAILIGATLVPWIQHSMR